MAGRKSDFTLPTLDDLFSTQEMRDDAKLAKIRDIPLELIDDFPDHPFKVRDDEDMMQLVESVKERGVITRQIASVKKMTADMSLFPVTGENERVSLQALKHSDVKLLT